MNVIYKVISRLFILLPVVMQSNVKRRLSEWRSYRDDFFNSSANRPAHDVIVAERCAVTKAKPSCDPLCALLPTDVPMIDLSAVTYNSSRWIAGFVGSLLTLDYPKNKLTIRFVDNTSTDSTLVELRAAALQLESVGYAVTIMQQPNRGFGAGHNVAIRMGTAPFCLVTNVDLVFEPNALGRVVATAVADAPCAAAWELRQKPYEHPKFYDPVTGTTNWNSHACVLIRRTAIDKIGGYDESLFMYGEDVELSYRLRRAGYLLRYCPTATVYHYSYEHESQVKPLQYIGSTYANLYLRLKYGNRKDIVAVPLLAFRLLTGTQAFPGARLAVLQNFAKLIYFTPKALIARQSSSAYFPFRAWDYEMARDGAFVSMEGLHSDTPKISVITRTYQGRSLYLRQAMLSVAHQTYPCIEYIVVEDGGETQRSIVEEISAITGHPILYIGLGKVGRSAAGNAGLSAATGRWCLFLDDDDLLFSDHIEVLANALYQNPLSVAAYTPAWEIVTDSARYNDGEYVEVTYELPAILRQPFDRNILLNHNFMAIQSVLFERQLYVERGGFEEDMDALEDWILWINYSQGNSFVYVPKVTSIYRIPACADKMHQRLTAISDAHPLALARVNRARY